MITRMGNPAAAASLFAGWEETLILSSLSGEMGTVWAEGDKPENALCLLGDFVFYAGHPSEELLRFSPFDQPRFMILTPQTPAWESAIETVYGERCNRKIRYSFSRQETRFDMEHLSRLAGQLPNGYQLAVIDRRLYDECRKHSFSRDFVSQFRDEEDYLTRGMGVAVLHGDHFVGGASSYSVFPGGIEIEIAIEESHRRKGLASACAARLILNCLDKNLYPSWDAANPTSVRLAQKLGYGTAREYPVYFTDHFGHP